MTVAPLLQRSVLALAAGLSMGAAAAENTNEIPPLRPLHDEIPATFWEQYGAWPLIIGYLLLMLLALFIWFLKRPRPVVEIPPAEQARRALAALPADAVDDATLSRVDQILRYYVRRVFELPPEELTTPELCRLLDDNQKVGPELSLLLAASFRANDFQKFSSRDASLREEFGPVVQARFLIEKCEARLAEMAENRWSPAGSSRAPA